MKEPIQLFFKCENIGTITNFGYETPWASGQVKFQDKTFFEKMVKVTSLLSYDLYIEKLCLPDAEEEKLWNDKLQELQLIWDDLRLDDDSNWSIQPQDDDRQMIHAVRFYEDEFMEWRQM